MPQNSSARKDDESFRLPAQEGNELTARSCSRVQSTLARGSKTICIPFDPQSSRELVGNEVDFRRHVDEQYARHPELFPAAMD
jgi:hypothetical protein